MEEKKKKKREARNARNKDDKQSDKQPDKQQPGKGEQGAGTAEGASEATPKPSTPIKLNTREQAMAQFRAAMAERRKFVASIKKDDSGGSDGDGAGDKTGGDEQNKAQSDEDVAAALQRMKPKNTEESAEASEDEGGADFDVLARISTLNSEL